MPNLRVCYDNAMDRYTAITATTTAGGLAAANMATEGKGTVWRSTAITTQSIVVTWTNPETVAMVAMPWTNLTSSATMRIRGYSDTAGTTLVLDTGTSVACRYVPPALRGLPSGANSFAYGGGAAAVRYFTATPIRRMVIDITDTANTLGYIEVSRLVIGNYWEPAVQADRGAQVIMEDDSTHERTESGDLKTDRTTRHKRMTLNLSMMKVTDRDALWEIMRGGGKAQPVWLSMMPASTDVREEWQFQIYGKLSELSAISYQFVNMFSSSIEIVEM